MGNALIERLQKFNQGEFARKKLIIYGAGGSASVICPMLKAINRVPSYLIDRDPNKHGTKWFDIDVKDPSNLLHENLDEIIIILALSDSEEAGNFLNTLGLIKNKHYFDLEKNNQAKVCDSFDPFLGYSRTDNIEGFKILGDPNSKIKVVTLGNSTTDYSFSNIKSWPAYLFDILRQYNDDVAVYNGGIGGYNTNQELLKLLRDVLNIKPDIIISFSGITDALEVCYDKKYPLTSTFSQEVIKTVLKSNYIMRTTAKPVSKISFGVECNIEPSANWYKNEKIMHAICKEFGIDFFAFLEPTMFTGKYEKSDIEEKYLKYKYGQKQNEIEGFFTEVAKLTRNEQFVHDISNMFNGLNGIFMDHVHTNECGNKMIAEQIYSKIKSSVEQRVCKLT